MLLLRSFLSAGGLFCGIVDGFDSGDVHEGDHGEFVWNSVSSLRNANDDMSAADDRHFGVTDVVVRTVGNEDPKRLKRFFSQES